MLVKMVVGLANETILHAEGMARFGEKARGAAVVVAAALKPWDLGDSPCQHAHLDMRVGTTTQHCPAQLGRSGSTGDTCTRALAGSQCYLGAGTTWTPGAGKASSLGFDTT
jgi:hypothetical protein